MRRILPKFKRVIISLVLGLIMMLIAVPILTSDINTCAASVDTVENDELSANASNDGNNNGDVINDQSIQTNFDTIEMNVGDRMTITVVIYNSDGTVANANSHASVTWSISDESIVQKVSSSSPKASSSITVLALKKGRTVITVASAYSKPDTLDVIVNHNEYIATQATPTYTPTPIPIQTLTPTPIPTQTLMTTPIPTPTPTPSHTPTPTLALTPTPSYPTEHTDSPIEDFQVTTINAGVLLRWNPIPKCIGYRIFRSDIPSDDGVSIAIIKINCKSFLSIQQSKRILFSC